MKPSITPIANGALKVTGAPELIDSTGSKLATTDVMFLCRCGSSSNKPYCDGTHSKNGFTTNDCKHRQPRTTKDYVGKHITIHDNRRLCAHDGVCTTTLPEVWSETKGKWIYPDDAPVDEIVVVINKCPSGALSYSIDGIYYPQHRPKAITVAQGNDVDNFGKAYSVSGSIKLTGCQPIDTEHYALCRCGQSKNMPYCDGSHWDAGFLRNK